MKVTRSLVSRPQALLLCIVLAVPIGSAPLAAAQVQASSTGATTRVSVASDGTEGDGRSERSSISADGRYVAFESRSSNLVPGDTNAAGDVFVRDRHTGTTERVSVASDGTEGDGWSWRPSISADGRYVAFDSYSSNLVPGDTNGAQDVFIHDRHTGTTERVSVASDGTEGNSGSYLPSVSADGRYVAFYSYSSNLVPGDTNGWSDVFVHDRHTGTTERVSVASDGTEGDSDSAVPSISADGRYVAFESWSTNLVPGDTNPAGDVFTHDRHTGTTERVSVASDGTEGNGYSERPSISADGRYVAFESRSSNLVPGDMNGAGDVFTHDRHTGTTERVSVASDGTEGDSDSYGPSISADGRYVAFESGSTNLVPGDTNGWSDVFTHDRHTGTTERVSVASDGTEGDDGSSRPSISADGRYVAFESGSTNLVPGDTNGWSDVFVRDREFGQPSTIELQHDAAGVVFDRWVTGYSKAYSGGGYVYGRWTGTVLTARFTGSKIRWVGPKQPFYGMADVYLDGVLVASDVDCYAPAGSATLEALIWESGTLSDGPHTIWIRLKGNRNASSSGNVVVIDRFEVDGAAPKGGGFRIDDAAAAPGYTGNWISAINPTYYDKTYSYSRWAGHVFSVTFNGTEVAWIGPMTPFYGKAEIWLDGSYVTTVDAYRSYQGWRERIWESETLRPGTHTLEIRPTGEKNPASTSANIVIDAIDVTP